MTGRISYNMYRDLRLCERRYFEKHVREDVPSKSLFDTSREFEVSVVKQIFNSIVNDKLYEELGGFNILTNIIDKELNSIKDYIIYYKDLKESYDIGDIYELDNIVIKFISFCLVEDSKMRFLRSKRDEIVNNIKNIYKEPLINLLQRDINKIESNVEISVNLGDFNVSGSIDFIEDKGDFLEVFQSVKKRVQFKDYEGKLISLNERDNLIFIKLLVEREYRKPVKRAGYWYWGENKFEFDDITDEETESLALDIVSKFNNVLRHQELEDYRFSPSFISCMFCLHKRKCLALGKSKDKILRI